MARVVSWRISYGGSVYYAYITSPGQVDEPIIKENTQLSQSDANKIGIKVLSYSSETEYAAHFETMRQKINLEIGHGAEIDLGGSAHRYWNITNSDENEEVLMLVGADGRNTSEDLNPYYNFHLVNQAIAIGTGEDYTLDVDADVECEAFFERNGVRYACNGENPLSILGDNSVFEIVSQRHGTESSNFTLRIKSGARFANDTHMLDCTIVGNRDGVIGKAAFTVSAVLGGKEGVSYDLIVSPKQFHFDSPQEAEASTGFVNVGVLRNGKKLTAAEIASENMKIGYEYDANGNNGLGFDNDDITIATIPTDGIFKLSPGSIYAGGGSVTFYLVVDDSDGRSVVDSDSASVVVDGVDGAGHIYLELDNEVEAIGVGDDSDLDLESGQEVTASTNVRMYSGETNLIITDIDVIDASVNSGKGTTWDEAHNTGEGLIDGSGQYYGTIGIILKNGFEFGEDLRDKVTVQVTGRHPDSSTLVATGRCAFTILGVKGGKDGVIYRLIPSCDYIMYDPNTAMVQFDAQEPIAVSELGNATIGAKAYVGNGIKSPGAITEDNEFIRYSIGAAYSNAQTAFSQGLTPNVSSMDYLVPLSSVLGDLGENNPASRYVTFYWIKKIGTTYYLIDRETVPVITAGIDGNYAKIELGNEIDAITIGDDTKLDIDSGVTVEVGTTVRAVDGALNYLDVLSVTADVIQDFNGWHSDSAEWPAAQFEVSTDNGETWVTPVAGNAYKLWRFWYELPNGFDFGEDKKEKIKLEVRYVLQDGTEHNGTAIFTIVGVPGGKEGQKYQLVPEVDIVRYFANDDTFDEETLNCDAIIGLERLEGGHIYYGTQVRTANGFRVLDIIDSTFKNYYVEGGQAQVRGMYFGNSGIAQFGTGGTSQIAWYLTIDTDDGELIVDHETVPIVSDGKDGDPAYTVELSNEIESIGTGTDTTLDQMETETLTASTFVYLLKGNEKVDIVDFSYEWVDQVVGVDKIKLFKVSDEDSTSQEGEIGPTNFGKYSLLNVVVNKTFDFGNDMRKRLIVKVAYKDNVTNEKFWVRGLFTLIGIKGGKDGMNYRIVPTPDYVLYDFETQSFPGGTSVSVKAYNGATLLSELNVPYEIYYSKDTVYDMESIPNTLTQVNGGVVTEAFGVPAKGVEQRITFYLKVDGKWVDRETVPLITNGKEGKDGAGSFRFDLVNPIEIINTGTDNILDATRTYTCVAYGYSGMTASPISVQCSGAETKCTIATGNTNDGGVQIDVTLSNGFAFNSSTMKKEIDITAASTRDESLIGNLKFVIVAVMNGNDGEPGTSGEGDSYKIRTNTSSVVWDGDNISPEQISAAVYLGSSLQYCTIYMLFVDGEDQLGLSSIMNKGTYNDAPWISYSSSSTSIKSKNVTEIVGQSPSANGTIYVAAFNGDDFLDYDDIPVILANLGGGGSASGVLADLTDDVGVVATGEDKKLEANTTLTTKVFVYDGHTPLQITDLKIATGATPTAFPYTYTAANGGTITFAKGNTPATQVKLTVTITASASNYIDFGTKNPLQFDILISAQTASEEDVYATTTYSILGLKGGKDGKTIRLVLNSNQIFYDSTASIGDRFKPSEILAKLFVGDEDVTANSGVSFEVKNSDMADQSGSELWMGFDGKVSGETFGKFSVTENSTNEYQPLTIRAKSGNIVMDWETVQVYRNGLDGEGSIEAKANPDNLFIPVENGNPKSVFNESVSVGLFSGSTQISIDGITATTNYSSFGTGSSKHVQYSITTDNLYKLFNITATTSTDLSAPITICLDVKGAGTTQIRRCSVTLNPSEGGQGAQGRQGAAIRGPVEWTNVGRRWCSGNGNAVGSSLDGDYQFLDVIFRTANSSKVYYYCNTSYTQSAGASWNSVSNYWTQAEEQFDFIATKVLLAKNGAIDFMTGNKIYLRDTGGTITAGAAGGNGISFWAGSDDPDNAPFKVSYDGSIEAKNGTFSGYIQMPYTFVSDLTRSSASAFNNARAYIADSRAYLVSDGANYSDISGFPANFLLPAATSEMNGFTYDIIVEPTLSRMDGQQQLYVKTENGEEIYCYSFSEMRKGKAITLMGGRYVITCMPKHSGNSRYYVWAITMATGGLIIENSDGNEYINSIVGRSYISYYESISSIMTYSGTTRPSEYYQSKTMFVSTD